MIIDEPGFLTTISLKSLPQKQLLLQDLKKSLLCRISTEKELTKGVLN